MIGSRSVRALVLMLVGYACLRTVWIWGPDILHVTIGEAPVALHEPRVVPGNPIPQATDTTTALPQTPGSGSARALGFRSKQTHAAFSQSRLASLHPRMTAIQRPGAGADLETGASPRPRPAPANTIDPDTATILTFARGPDSASEPRPGFPRPGEHPSMHTAGSRWSGYAYLFHRSDGGATDALAPAGQIGGSQAAARLAYRLDAAGRVAVSARIATPLRATRQADSAIGVDLLPAPGLRLALERRIALGRQGRNAWSAYAAGGLYRALTPAIALDGYAQAGLVGTRTRDPFADGALRLAHRTAVTPVADFHLGAGLWGAAQPRAARLDIGPRAAVTLRLPRAPVTLALEGRVRIAGRARPGNGLALTLASDF